MRHFSCVGSFSLKALCLLGLGCNCKVICGETKASAKENSSNFF